MEQGIRFTDGTFASFELDDSIDEEEGIAMRKNLGYLLRGEDSVHAAVLLTTELTYGKKKISE